jgi:hypothetical protein
MCRLSPLQAGDLVPDELFELRDGGDVLIESIDDRGQLRLDRGPECREPAARLDIEADEACSDGKIALV